MRFLCLHGQATNAEIFKSQTASIRKALGDDIDYLFINGNFATEQHSNNDQIPGELVSILPNGLESDVETCQRLFKELQTLVRSQGPFDGIMAFSEGATVAMGLLIEDCRTHFAQFKCAILFCTACVYNAASQESGSGEELILRESPGSPLVTIPTAHIWSIHDSKVAEDPRIAADICDPAMRYDYIHDLGHCIPDARASKHFHKSLQIIERTIERAHSIQIRPL